MYNGDRARKMTLVEHGFRLPSALDNRPLKFDEWEAKPKQVIFCSATPSDYEFGKTNGEVVEQIKDLRASHRIEAAMRRIEPQVHTAEEPVTARIRRKLAATLDAVGGSLPQ